MFNDKPFYSMFMCSYIYNGADSAWTFTDFSLFGKEVRDAVDALTKRETETREEYLIRCSLNPIARVVKLHDAAFNAHNSHKENNQSRVDYYLQTMLIVSTAQDRLR